MVSEIKPGTVFCIYCEKKIVFFAQSVIQFFATISYHIVKENTKEC